MHLEVGIPLDKKFDPWALPEVQDFGPKWSGKIAAYFTVACLFLWLIFVEIPALNLFVLIK